MPPHLSNTGVICIQRSLISGHVILSALVRTSTWLDGLLRWGVNTGLVEKADFLLVWVPVGEGKVLDVRGKLEVTVFQNGVALRNMVEGQVRP